MTCHCHVIPLRFLVYKPKCKNSLTSRFSKIIRTLELKKRLLLRQHIKLSNMIPVVLAYFKPGVVL